MEPTLSDLFRKTAERVSEEGMWCQGLWYDIGKLPRPIQHQVGAGASGWIARKLRERHLRVPECLDGALISVHAELTGSVHGPLRQKARRALYRELGQSPISWNDENGRTQDEVVALCRSIADRLDGIT